MRRRALLATVGGLPAGLAGCLASFGGTPTATPPVEAEVDLAPCPDRPSPLTEASVEPFVEQFERAHVGRQVLARFERVASFQFPSLGTQSVVAVEDGYRVALRCQYTFSNYASATATARTYSIFGHYWATYLVTDRAVYRAIDPDSELEPRTDGKRVGCPPAG